jgi:hypothetical protein
MPAVLVLSAASSLCRLSFAVTCAATCTVPSSHIEPFCSALTLYTVGGWFLNMCTSVVQFTSAVMVNMYAAVLSQPLVKHTLADVEHACPVATTFT